MTLIAVGTNHKYSPIELRERLSFPKKRLKNALDFLKEGRGLKGAVILSTCNRVEIYASAEDFKIGTREITDFISRYHEIDKRKFSHHLYIYEGKQALKHLFSVVCGLDSLILGETQISGQVKFSFLESEDANFADGLLKEVFYSAESIAKRIHRDTKISEGKVSVGSVAIDFIRGRIGRLTDKNILIIGVGKVTELVLKYLKKEGPKVVFISNRTFEKAQDLARQIGATVVRFNELGQFLKRADIIITATASPHFVIKRKTLQKVISHCAKEGPAPSGKLLILDLALPRDVEPGVKEIEKVDLFCLEDLDTAIKENMEKKFQEAEKAKEFIVTEAERLWNKLTESELEPALLH